MLPENLIKEIENDSIDNFFYLPIEQNPLSIMFTDRENNILYINKAFTDITGYIIDEVRGKNPKILASGKRSLHDYQKMWKQKNIVISFLMKSLQMAMLKSRMKVSS